MADHVQEATEVDSSPDEEESCTLVSRDETRSLSEACALGLTQKVLDLINDGADVNTCPAFSGADMQALSWQDRNITSSDITFNCPLYQAVLNDCCDIAELLVKNGAKYIKLCPVQVLPVHYNADIRGVAAENCMTVKAFSGSLLQVAVIHSSATVVRFLLDSFQADISFHDVFKSLEYASTLKEREAVRAILEGYNFESCEGNPDKAIDPAVLKHLLYCTFWDSTPEDETLPLLFLEKFGKFVADNNLCSSSCQTMTNLLSTAVCEKLGATVQKLIQLIISHMGLDQFMKHEGINVMMNDIGATALCNGSLPILQTLESTGLLDLSQQPNALFQIINCSSHRANSGELISWLVSKCGFDPRALNRDGMEPLHLAIRACEVSCVEALALHGADINSVNAVDWMTPAHLHLNFCLVQQSMDPDVQLLHTLISHGADLAAVNRPGYTPLSVLFWFGQSVQMMQAALCPQFRIADYSEMSRFPWNAFFTPVQVDKDLAQATVSSQYDPAELGELPFFFEQNHLMRSLMEKLVSKFGLALLSMGADKLLSPLHWQRMEVSLHRANISWKHVPSLQTFCWSAMRRSLGGVHFQHKVGKLPLPENMKKFLICL